uniref:Putative insulin-like growth factor-binding protein complex acid labile subunit isoform x3 n=1 Tax=Haematobia irritans TaxID=7368 RepID=A0A1L8EB73_HAEIR
MDLLPAIVLIIFTIGIFWIPIGDAQHEDIPYENVENICKTCECLRTTVNPTRKQTSHQTLNCSVKGFKHILARWPEEFGRSQRDTIVVASFSGNTIEILQQLPATNATLSFACRHCGIKYLQSPTFMDVPNIVALDLAYNSITPEELIPNVFRRPYESIALIELDLSHNKLQSLDRHLFQHTPNLTKLNVAHNNFRELDNPTTAALTSLVNLQDLDLSNTGIKTIPSVLLEKLVSLRSLNLAGNKFAVLPDNFHLLGKSLQSLNLAGNIFINFEEKSFLGLRALTHLNISGMSTLRSIKNHTFSQLEQLTYLDCSHNPNLEKFDLNSLMHCKNLTYLDISHGHISSLTLDMDLSLVLNNTNVTYPGPWPKLKTFEIAGNTWMCTCDLLQTLEYTGSHHRREGEQTRCDMPYIFAGAKLSNLNASEVCSMKIPVKYQIIDEDPPRFRRKRYVILTVITASVVVVLGLIIGLIVVCIRRRLKRDDFGVEPIRYTSVRSSNLSAFSHGHANGGVANAANGATTPGV